jgi:hypothetical protein
MEAGLRWHDADVHAATGISGMRVYSWRGAQRNFGDELNAILWPRLLPGLLDGAGPDLLLGIGSVLDARHPPRAANSSQAPAMAVTSRRPRWMGPGASIGSAAPTPPGSSVCRPRSD